MHDFGLVLWTGGSDFWQAIRFIRNDPWQSILVCYLMRVQPSVLLLFDTILKNRKSTFLRGVAVEKRRRGRQKSHGPLADRRYRASLAEQTC